MLSANPTKTSPPRRRSVVGWVLYDLANTIFSINIVSFYFSVWVVNVMGATDSTWASTYSLSMFAVLLLSPLLGALSDQAPRRMPFLMVSTLICVALTMTLGRFGLTAALVSFALANVAYQAGLQFYDSLLPEVTTTRTRGRVGGIGIAAGYLGAVAAMLLGRVILAGVESLDPPAQTARYVAVFSLSAGLFLILAIPCFVLVKERVRERQFGIAAVPRAFRQVGRTLTRELPRHRDLVRFLIGRFFYTDAVNTVILFMGIYVTNAVGFTTGEASLVMLIAIVAATAGGLGWGRVVDAIGPKRTLEMVLGLWIVVFAWTALVGFLRLPPATFWPVPCLAGIALGGTWTADRPLLLRLSPPEQVGEFYGLYGMMSRFSAIVGPQLWRLVSDTLGLGRPAAVMCLLVFIVIAMVILRPLPTFPAGDEEPENDRSARGVPIS